MAGVTITGAPGAVLNGVAISTAPKVIHAVEVTSGARATSHGLASAS